MSVPYAEVIGDPIAHSKSPLIHRFWLDKLGLVGDYRATCVTTAALSSYFEARRGDPDWRGCNVTMPHKLVIWPLLAPAHADGHDTPINCVVSERTGLDLLNFDVDALSVSIPPGAGRVIVVGTGGAAAASLLALDGRPVGLISRNRSRTSELQSYAPDGYAPWYVFEDAQKALKGADGVINATPLGMRGFQPMPASVVEALSAIQKGGFVYEMVYDPPMTALLARAERLGLRTVDGLTMLIEQAASSFARFFAAEAPRSHDGELRELLMR